ncbi:GAF domain-containing protein [Streptomyces xanthochromogenes]|uniref:ANTAR domain-containing protein n=1 Tax=Streptomyces xanthochromogenes TaxID=67384 RepID=UPI001673483F|nr:ANTAR domain-containing protein [Streptomyces xanthochromogenes]GHB58915.1 GAF domain-containing protein [Streptomyces xanthochromogenes]
MISDGMADVLRSLRHGDGGVLAAACARALQVDGVAVSLLVGAGRDAEPEPLWHSPGIAADFEELQFTLGTGPTLDAAHSGTAVVVPDLAAVRADRWPGLPAEALGLGVAGAYCFPLGLGAIRLGVLTAVTGRADDTVPEQRYADALALAAALTGLLLEHDGGGDGPAVSGSVTGVPRELHRAVVHQATGMVSVQLDVSLADALLRLRAFAYARDLPLGDVAEDVVAGRLRFNDDRDGPPELGGRKG